VCSAESRLALAVASVARIVSAMDAAARWGFAARGVIYLLIGLLALQIAFTGGGKQADRGGALAEIAEKPMGSVVLWALGVGLVGMSVWRLSEAVFGAAGPDGRKASKRLFSAGRFIFYGFMAYSVLAFAAGDKNSGSGSSDQQSQDVTARAMDLPAGRWLVGIVGVAIAAAGLWIGARAVMRKRAPVQLNVGNFEKNKVLGEIRRE